MGMFAQGGWLRWWCAEGGGRGCEGPFGFAGGALKEQTGASGGGVALPCPIA
jgi:hypothetical protein